MIPPPRQAAVAARPQSSDRSRPRRAFASTRLRHLPGEAGTWVFIFGDMTMFALLFGAYLHGRAADLELFRTSQSHLDVGLATVNTLLLLTSSLLIVTAVRSLRNGAGAMAPRLIAGAIACGIAFAVNKVFEYAAKIDQGHDPGANEFFTYFYLLTGLHLFHLLAGLGVLCVVAVLARRKPLTPRHLAYVEGGGCYWHMVDLLWIVLFALLYLAH